MENKMATGPSCKPKPKRINDKLLYLKCQWKPHKGIYLELRYSKYKIYEFWHKVHNRSEQQQNPRATEEPRAEGAQGCLNSQSELMENSMGIKECLDVPKRGGTLIQLPWMYKGVEQVPGGSPWISRVFAAKTNHFPWLKSQTPCRKKFLISSAQLPGFPVTYSPSKEKSFSISF